MGFRAAAAPNAALPQAIARIRCGSWREPTSEALGNLLEVAVKSQHFRIRKMGSEHDSCVGNADATAPQPQYGNQVHEGAIIRRGNPWKRGNPIR